MAQIPIHLYKRLSIYFYLATLLLLIGVIFFGVKGGGAQRWLDLGVALFSAVRNYEISDAYGSRSILAVFHYHRAPSTIVFGFLLLWQFPPILSSNNLI